MINRNKFRLVLTYYWEFSYKYKIHFKVMLENTVYEWVGLNSHSMGWSAGTGPGLYKQIVVATHEEPFNIIYCIFTFFKFPLGSKLGLVLGV